jgi:hypothetical protein
VQARSLAEWAFFSGPGPTDGLAVPHCIHGLHRNRITTTSVIIASKMRDSEVVVLFEE